MGRPPTHGAPAFRFLPSEVATMENVLQAHGNALPTKEFLEVLAHRFSESGYRKGKTMVQMKQVWNWFQNKRAAIRSKLNKNPGKLNISPMTSGQSIPFRTDAHPSAALVSLPLLVPSPAPASAPAVSLPVLRAGRAAYSTCYREFEARSSRDGAWYDVASFLSHRFLEPGDPDVLVRFAGFGMGEDEWININRHVRLRSSPCESSECVLVLPGDPVLCFQERKEKALYFDAHVLDVQRRTHDFRGCRCRFLVQYDHDQNQEVVPLRKICRRPESDIRLQRLYVTDEPTIERQNTSVHSSMSSVSKVSSPASTSQDQQNSDVVVAAPDTYSNMSGTIESKSPDLKASGTSSIINTGNSSNSIVGTNLKAGLVVNKTSIRPSENEAGI